MQKQSDVVALQQPPAPTEQVVRPQGFPRARFSTAAAGVLAALLATGWLLAWRIVGSWDHLVGTTYGQLLLAKVAVVAVAIAIAAWNRFVLLPRTRGSSGEPARSHLGRAVAAEALCLAGALMVTGFLVNQSPSVASADGPGRSTDVQTVRLGDLTLVVTLTPRRQGQNTVVIELRSPTGEPLAPGRPPVVSLRSTNVQLGSMEITRTRAGTFAAEVVLPSPGQWKVQVSQRRSAFENPVASVPAPDGGQPPGWSPVLELANDPGGGVMPFMRHHSPGGRWLRRGTPLDGSCWNGIGGSGGSSWSFSDSSSVASFSSDMPIGPTRWALRNWRTTGSSELSSISRGPNIARCLW